MSEKDENSGSNLVRSEYVYTGGFKRLAALKLRIGKWLEEERGRGRPKPLENRPDRGPTDRHLTTTDGGKKADESSIVQPVYDKSGSKLLTNLKLRIGKWLEEERGW